MYDAYSRLHHRTADVSIKKCQVKRFNSVKMPDLDHILETEKINVDFPHFVRKSGNLRSVRGLYTVGRED